MTIAEAAAILRTRYAPSWEWIRDTVPLDAGCVRQSCQHPLRAHLERGCIVHQCSNGSLTDCDRFVPPAEFLCPHPAPLVATTPSGKTYVRCRQCPAELALAPEAVPGPR
jgi:hypothetical protein